MLSTSFLKRLLILLYILENVFDSQLKSTKLTIGNLKRVFYAANALGLSFGLRAANTHHV